MKHLDHEAALKMFDSERRRERQRRQRQRVVACCKQLAAFLFSHVGLASMVVAYHIMGGFLFRAIEAPFEQRVKVKVVGLRELMVDEIWKLASDLAEARVRLSRAGSRTIAGGPREAAERQNFTTRVEDIFGSFQREVRDAVKNQGWDGNDDMDETQLQWSFAGALLYAVTVTTTIGMHSHQTPGSHNTTDVKNAVSYTHLTLPTIYSV